MYHQWFFGRRRRCCCQNSYQRSSETSSGVYGVAYYRHFANVPMRVFYGPGFTVEDSLESIDNSLETIAEQFTLNQTTCRRNCC